MTFKARYEHMRDDWGIPHLRADDALALAYGQGHATALDRAWQLEFDRHRVQGTTAAFLGEEAVDWDRFARQSRLDDTAQRCFRTLEPETAAWVTAYTDGVNAALAEGASQAPEFTAMGLAPGTWRPWTPLGVWLATHILFAGFPTKIWRDEVARLLGEEAIGLFATDGPGTTGSNGWLVEGERTATGAPIIAGDPHRYIEDPGVYQQIRLACPEFDVVGLAVPGVPGIAHFAHTGGVAWAITNAMADYQDLYREQLRRTGDGRVEALGPDGWRPAAAHTETIDVAGAAPVTVEIIETDRGPVIAGGPQEPSAPSDRRDMVETAGDDDQNPQHAAQPFGSVQTLSLRQLPRVTGELGFDALPALLRARTVADVDAALDRWVEPVNVVLAADTSGATLYRVAGYVPRRPYVNSLRPVPAWESVHGWRAGRAPTPRKRIEGLAVMANERGLAAPLGVEFAPPHRADRIGELLATSTDWTATDMAAIHTDTLLASAGPLLGLLAAAPGLSPDAVRLRDRLLTWDRHMDAASTDASLYAAVRAHVVHRLAAHPSLAPLVGPGRPARPGAYPGLFLPWLAALPRIGFALEFLLDGGPVPHGERIAMVAAAAESIARSLAEPHKSGPGPWASAHQLVTWQALPGTAGSSAAPASAGLAGDHDCVLSTSSTPGITHHSTRGPAARYVWDLARREDSLWIVPLGASGVPGDAHHRDQLPLWVEGALVPVTTDWNLLHRTEEKTPMSPAPAALPPARRTPLHEQKIDGFGTIVLVPVHPATDLDLLYSWVTEERARFWGMGQESREQVLETYEFLDSLATHHALLAVRDGVPVALFQTYDPAADPVGECYEVRRGDYGVHLLIAPHRGAVPEPGFTGALLSVLIAYVFSDPANLRVVVEPDVSNEKALTRMLRAGFVLGPEIDKPEKRARLAFLSREAAAAKG
ncbi:GNAT family N-acetyltransferase [Streptomyces sp. NBC_01465]|uniref:GNAT family N-acetyltransferase n=1 Tax=Streptomyces sp. NBC_01465 TaxID=2903878 RepID=UPI002E340987|nr:GNAT family N-acetyltransferase [Streptomyces sp. NBC_01465]